MCIAGLTGARDPHVDTYSSTPASCGLRGESSLPLHGLSGWYL